MRGILFTLVGFALLGTISGHARQDQIPPNRCLPGQSCFPSRQALAAFAATLTGSLVQPFDSVYASLVNMANNRNTRHPYIIVVAGDIGDVQKAMKFARKYQLMVTSQVSTADVSGRSTYDGAMQINLSQLTGVTSLTNETSRSAFGEVTAYAGTTWDSVYSQALTIGRDVVTAAGVDNPVGMTVGDGGIGPLVKVYGLVVDNVLEVKMVTADGNLVTVTEYTVEVDFGDGLVRRTWDHALFAAVNGGGVGPWGIVVSYTFKLHPAPPQVVSVTARYKMWESGTFVGESILNFLLGAIPLLPQKWGAYVDFDGSTSDNIVATKGEIVVRLLWYGAYGSDSDYFFVDNVLNFQAPESVLELTVTNLTSVLQFQRQLAGAFFSRLYHFNTLLQLDKVTDEKLEDLVGVMKYVLNSPTVESSYGCLGIAMGGASQVDARNVSFVNPALRSSFFVLQCALGYPGKGLDDSFYVSHALDYAAMLDQFGEGKYRYSAQQDLPDWKREFHGEKYGALIDTKVKYDIDNFLWCHNCVGSDFRVDCKYNDKHRGVLLSGYISSQRAARNRQQDMDHRVRDPYVNLMTQH